MQTTSTPTDAAPTPASPVLETPEQPTPPQPRAPRKRPKPMMAWPHDPANLTIHHVRDMLECVSIMISRRGVDRRVVRTAGAYVPLRQRGFHWSTAASEAGDHTWEYLFVHGYTWAKYIEGVPSTVLSRTQRRWLVGLFDRFPQPMVASARTLMQMRVRALTNLFKNRD